MNIRKLIIMSKVYFKNDYSELAAPEVLAYMQKISGGHYNGYGLDEICESAAACKERKNQQRSQKSQCFFHVFHVNSSVSAVLLTSIPVSEILYRSSARWSNIRH